MNIFIALRANDVNLENLSVEVSKAIWGGEEDTPKTEAGCRSICLSACLCAALKEYLAGRTDGYLFQTSTGKHWDSSSVLGRRLNGLLERLEIPKLDPKLLTKFVGKDRSIEQATRSEKRAASLGLHSFRHTNVTAMDSLGVPQQIRKQRIGHSAGSVTEIYTHTFTQDERAAAEKLDELFGTGWPETDKGKVISFPNLSQKEEGLPIGDSEALGPRVPPVLRNSPEIASPALAGSEPRCKQKGRTPDVRPANPQLVAGTCNHPNCLVLPFSVELIRLA